MEWNGLAYDVELSLKSGRELEHKVKEITSELDHLAGVDGINWNSPDQMSYVLYGGVLKTKEREEYPYTYKSGPRKGTTVLKERIVVLEHNLPRLIDPPKNAKGAKEGVFSTNEKILAKLKSSDKRVQRILDGVLELRGLQKRIGTYYYGIPKLYKEMEWTNNILHGNLNSCTAVTGRLASTQPNQQNMDHKIRECIKSRFAVSS